MITTDASKATTDTGGQGIAEREDLIRIFTLDRRHFSVYRPGRRRRFSILPE